jgi:tetratricopeptide (TPR) repeat protein
VSGRELRRIVVCAALVAASALAQPPEGDRPWARGVPRERQAEALQLFREANGKLRDALYRAARDKYLEALKLWDHPAIHYNLSLSLMNLDQPVEAWEHLQLALKYGAAPLDADKMDQALRYRGLVEKQLTRLRLSCSLEGAVVRLDGNTVFTGQGQWEGMVRAGAHSVVATLEGYVPTEKALTLVGGEAKALELKLYRTEDLTEYRRVMPLAVPWVVVGAGVALAGGGVALQLSARSSYASYDTAVGRCAVPTAAGCTPRPDIALLRSSGDLLQTLAWASYLVGGAAVITGSVLLYVNRPQAYLRSVDAVTPTATLAPLLVPGGAGLSLVGTF